LHKAICISGFLGTLVFGAWLAIHVLLSPWHREYRRRRTALNNARHCLEEVENEWRQTVSRYRRAHDESRHSIERLISQCRGLTTQYQVELQRLTANAEEMARIRHLRLHLIADADIPKIGAGRKQVLASNGIVTAADIDDYRIRGIKGFGDVLTSNLLGWKNKVLQEFRFDRKTAVSPGEQRSITVKFRNGQQQILAELNRQIGNLESLAPACRAALQKLIPELQRAVALYEQAEADLHLLYGK
jgi:DNA-binding helix-hairpin-helix protein with protein kinase domain